MTTHNLFSDLKMCVVIPTYNNCKTLRDVIDRVAVYTTNIIVVNDGSTDKTAEILSNYPVKLDVVVHPMNQGKGCALKNGFKRALESGYEYAITIDSDGQHFPEDLPRLIARSQAEPNSIIIGSRNMEQGDVPQGSSFGNRFSNFWFLVETGIRLPDTQSGYRVYPIKLLSRFKFYCTKFEYEIEVPVRAAWSNIPVIAEPIQIIYGNSEDRVSHFRPYKDFLRISVLNTILCIIAFAYIKPRDFIKKLSWKNIKTFVSIRNESNIKLAFSIGFGVFMGILPIWGYQMLIALALAYVFRLHKPLVIIAANISIPPMIPFIIIGSLGMGGLVLGKPLFPLSLTGISGITSITNHLYQYIVGSVVLAILLGFVSCGLSYLLLLLFRRK